MNKRINVYIREKTLKLLKDYMDMEEYDMSRAVDEIIHGRLSYLEEARKKAEEKTKKEAKKNQTDQEWEEEYWKTYKEEKDEQKKIS